MGYIIKILHPFTSSSLVTHKKKNKLCEPRGDNLYEIEKSSFLLKLYVLVRAKHLVKPLLGFQTWLIGVLGQVFGANSSPVVLQGQCCTIFIPVYTRHLPLLIIPRRIRYF